MDNLENQFDKIFRDKLENFEVPYREAHWNEMESKIDNSSLAAKSSWSAGKIAAFIGGAAIVATAIYFVNSQVLKDNSSINNQGNSVQVPSQLNEDNIASGNDTNLDKMEASNELKVQGNSTNSSNKNSPSEKNIKKGGSEKTIEDEISKISSNNSQQIKSNAESFVENNAEPPISHPSTVNYDNKRLKTSFTADKTSICAGSEVQFTVEKEIDNVVYYWNFGDGGTSREKNPLKTFTRPGTYSVTLIVSKGEKNDFEAVREDFITVHPSPKFDIEWDSSEPTLYDPYTEFSVKTDADLVSYDWKINGEKYASKEVEHIFKDKGFYVVELKVDNGNCSTTKVKEVDISKTSRLPIESAFTINGDGINDLFPAILSTIDVQFELKILDRTGKQLYATKDNNQPWNGRVNNSGEIVPEGKYKCIIITKDKYNKERVQIAFVTVMR